MEDRRTRTDGAKKRHSESGGGLLCSCSAEEQTGRLPDSGQVACRFAGAWVRVSARLRAESRGVNQQNFNALPMLGRSLSKAVQGSEGNRRSLPSLGRHAQHDFQGLEDGDKPDGRAVRVAGCAGGGLAGSDGEGRRPERDGGNNGGSVGRRNVLLLLFARARIGILRIGGPEAASCFAESFRYAGQSSFDATAPNEDWRRGRDLNPRCTCAHT